MKRTALVAALAVVLAAGLVRAEEMKHSGSAVTDTPQWEQIKTLVGEWDGNAVESSQRIPTHVSIRMTGDGSVVMHWIDAGTPHEMITMFHMDRDELLATHYCSAHNQPRMRALPSVEPNRIAFEFKDGTNIRPGDGYMRRLVITFVDADHHDEEWGFDTGGQIHAGVFHMTRVQPAAKP